MDKTINSYINQLHLDPKKEKAVRQIVELAGGSGGGGMTEVTYAELRELRDNGKLVPGAKYRMIDYETTTDAYNTQSAGHQFDLICTALDINVIDTKCSAIQSIRDTEEYFTNSKLSSWQIWYSLENSKYNWATYNGKGVIYHLIDENNNEAFYDFKNIQFKIKLGAELGYENEIYKFVYTFSKIVNDDVLDYSSNKRCSNNKIINNINPDGIFLPNSVFLTNDDSNILNNIINSTDFIGIGFNDNNEVSGYWRNKLVNCSFNKIFNSYNVILIDCTNNTIIESNDNKITDGQTNILISSYNNTLNSAGSNQFTGCRNINLIQYCSYNKFNNCNNITLNTSCTNNTFEDGCHGIELYKNHKNCVFEHDTNNIKCINNTNDYIQNYKISISYIHTKIIDLQLQSYREYITYVTTDTNNQIIEYTSEDIYNAIQATKS